MAPFLDAAMKVGDALGAAYATLAKMHNAPGLRAELDVDVGQFWGRPFPVIRSERFINALLRQTRDREVKHIATLPLIGGIYHWSENADVESVDRGRLRQLYGYRCDTITCWLSEPPPLFMLHPISGYGRNLGLARVAVDWGIRPN